MLRCPTSSLQPPLTTTPQHQLDQLRHNSRDGCPELMV